MYFLIVASSQEAYPSSEWDQSSAEDRTASVNICQVRKTLPQGHHPSRPRVMPLQLTGHHLHVTLAVYVVRKQQAVFWPDCHSKPRRSRRNLNLVDYISYYCPQTLNSHQTR